MGRVYLAAMIGFSFGKIIVCVVNKNFDGIIDWVTINTIAISAYIIYDKVEKG